MEILGLHFSCECSFHSLGHPSDIMFQQRYWGRNVYGNALREISKSTEGNFGWEEVLSLSFSLSLSLFFFFAL